MGKLDIYEDLIFIKWLEDTLEYLGFRLRENKKLKVLDIVYNLASRDNITFYLLQKYGTSYLKAIEDELNKKAG